MQNRSTAGIIKEVLGNPDLAGIILSHDKDYSNFRLTCKYIYTAVEHMSFGLKLNHANSFRPHSINEFFYNHPYLSAGAMAFCVGSLAGSNIILYPTMSFFSGALGGVFAISPIGMIAGLYAYKQGETISHIISATSNIIKGAFNDSLRPDIVLGAWGLSTVLMSGEVCAHHGLGGAIGSVHQRCENNFEQGIAFLATGAAISGFFANRHIIKSNLKKREEKKNEIYEEFFKNKAT